MFSKLFAIAPLIASAMAVPALQARATGGVVTNPSIAVTSIKGNDGTGAGTDAYHFFKGDGTTGWPGRTQWASFEDMFKANTPVISQSCSQFSQQNPSPAEIKGIHDGINTVALETKVDHRFILAVIMQESKGCVRVWSTTSPGPDAVVNPGLMQDHDGKANCNANAQHATGGVVQNPCPNSTITQMIRDGTDGTAAGDGLAQTLNQAAGTLTGTNSTSTNGTSTSGTAFYRAARLYNSGAIAPSGDLGQGVATHCYASDIANRLVGWTGNNSTCTLDTTS